MMIIHTPYRMLMRHITKQRVVQKFEIAQHRLLWALSNRAHAVAVNFVYLDSVLIFKIMVG
jgi:hypothetical protein